MVAVIITGTLSVIAFIFMIVFLVCFVTTKTGLSRLLFFLVMWLLLSTACISLVIWKAAADIFSFLSGGRTAGEKERQPVEPGMAYIEGGSFVMNIRVPDPEKEHSYLDAQKEITINSFYMSKYELTQKEYLAVMGEFPSDFHLPYKGDNLPVMRIGWREALVFCNALSEREGLTPVYQISEEQPENRWAWTLDTGSAWNRNAGGYRLPTSAEWEYACRAGDTAESPPDIQSISWQQDVGSRPHPVGQKKPNAWGLYDMFGNVGEWCWGFFWLDGSLDSAAVDPAGPLFSNTILGHIIRGSGRMTKYNDSSWLEMGERGGTGIRLVRSADPRYPEESAVIVQRYGSAAEKLRVQFAEEEWQRPFGSFVMREKLSSLADLESCSWYNDEYIFNFRVKPGFAYGEYALGRRGGRIEQVDDGTYRIQSGDSPGTVHISIVRLELDGQEHWLDDLYYVPKLENGFPGLVSAHNKNIIFYPHNPAR
jgi:formylglycine-generating enzyme required for sulfatase activity